MRGTPFNLHDEGFVEAAEAAEVLRKKQRGEPRSVLDQRSPSPPTSTSTGGGSADSAGVAAVSDETRRKWPPIPPDGGTGGGGSSGYGVGSEWASELLPVPSGLEIGFLDWDSMVSGPAAAASSSSPGLDQTSFLRCVMADGDGFSGVLPKQCYQHQMLQQAGLVFEDPFLGFENLPGIYPLPTAAPTGSFSGISAMKQDDANRVSLNPCPLLPSSPACNFPFPLVLSAGGAFQDPTVEEKPHPLFNPNLGLNPQLQVRPPLQPYSRQEYRLLLPPDSKRHHSMENPVALPGRDLPQIPAKQDEMAAMVDELVQAAAMVEARSFTSARGILARLNHQLSSSGKPVARSAFYCKEALLSYAAAMAGGGIPTPPPQTPLDVILKLSAYKSFSDASPVLQFAYFTCAQAILEELGGCDRLHIVDFDLGVGGQWSSFMQELAHKRSSLTSLRITAFASPAVSHPLELELTRESLSNFAGDLGIPFEVNVLSIDAFDPASFLELTREDEAVAVNLPASGGLSWLRLVKELRPRIVVSVDHGVAGGESQLPRQLLRTLQSAAVLLDSVDAAGVDSDTVGKIEQYLVKPSIQNAVWGRSSSTGEVAAPPCRDAFAAAGFSPVQFSNFVEMQADCLIKRSRVRGFHVEKRQVALTLCWQRGELVSVAAWRC